MSLKRFDIALTHGNAILLKDSQLDKVIDLEALAHLLNNSYIVPTWCNMSLSDHFDGMGGCWGVSHGNVAAFGEAYCKRCEFHKGNNEAAP